MFFSTWESDWIVKAINGDEDMLKVDTGSQANLVPYSVYKKIQAKPHLESSSFILRSYNCGVIKHVVVINQQMALNGQRCCLSFFVDKKGSAGK